MFYSLHVVVVVIVTATDCPFFVFLELLWRLNLSEAPDMMSSWFLCFVIIYVFFFCSHSDHNFFLSIFCSHIIIKTVSISGSNGGKAFLRQNKDYGNSSVQMMLRGKCHENKCLM